MRVRVRFTKHGKVRFTSHRDTARIWERVLRKAGIAVAYSEGFSPRPKLHFGLALSTGYESDAEYLDVDLATEPTAAEVATFPERLTAALPPGMQATAADRLAPGSPSLQQAVTCSRWRIEVTDRDSAALAGPVADALGARTLPLTRVRKGVETTDDIRPYLAGLRVGEPTVRGVELIAELGTQPRSLRPAELLRALDPAAEEGLVVRTHQWIEHDGVRAEPLPVPQPEAERGRLPRLVGASVKAPYAEARAS